MNQIGNLTKGQDLHINGNVVEIGLSWQMSGNRFDLDLTAVRFSDMGTILDAVYFNQAKTEDGSIVHSGDERTGKSEGYDEKVTVYLNTVPLTTKVIAIIVNSSTGMNFRTVQSAEVRITLDGKQILLFNCGAEGDHTSVLSAFLYRANDSNLWMIRNIAEGGNQNNFVESVPLILKNMRFLVDEVLLDEAKSWNTKTGKSFNLQKGGDKLMADCLEEIAIGLGWETRCDLDSLVLEIDNNFNLVESVTYSHKVNRNGSIRHQGDNTTGIGKGDDENIIINLKQIERKVMYLVCGINVYTREKTFNNVTQAYCRLIDWSTKTEFCKFNLNGYGPKKMCLLAYLKRDMILDSWKIHAAGKFFDVYSKDTLVQELKSNILRGESLPDNFRGNDISSGGVGEYQAHVRVGNRSNNSNNECCSIF